jgi:polyhydroxyalkanoate synthesis repressor PhaR
MRTIKRYSNRKLYDTEQKYYTTLEALAVLIRQGEDIRVVDHVTDADLTSQTLAQIIFEEERRSPKLDVTTLHGLIRQGKIAAKLD